MGSLRLIVGVALALAISSFGVINMKPVTVAYYQGSVSAPLFYVLLAVFACGFMAAWFGGAFDRLRFRSQIGKLKREVKTLENTLDEAREQSGRLLSVGNNPEVDDPASALEEDARQQQTASAPRTNLSPRESRTE